MGEVERRPPAKWSPGYVSYRFVIRISVPPRS